jgi:hypothetical protein
LASPRPASLYSLLSPRRALEPIIRFNRQRNNAAGKPPLGFGECNLSRARWGYRNPRLYFSNAASACVIFPTAGTIKGVCNNA